MVDLRTVMNSRTVLVTGSSRGIGKAIAIEMARNGADVIVNYLKNKDDALEVSKVIQKMGRRTDCIRADIRHRDDVKKMIESILEKFGKIDVLVNNGGIVRDRTLHKMTDDEWDDVIQTNLTGAYNVTKEVINNMRQNNHGRIINIASVIGQTGNFGQTNYAASKGGLIAFTKSLAQEVVSHGITVNAIAPGFIDTDMTKSMPEKIRNEILRKIPVKRLGTPEEVAVLACYLTSEQASFITGQVININGGLYL